ncbi:3-deoxy-D-manno-octulosonic-acid transferase [Polaromonas sp. YR568]|uniref:3-deoxy-D-manno-octulosonic acid transferase n=1 Tax=Polaromonas sp. YR568 TaxID=1855301 RepID=UPI0008F38602|nr:3-deoxy-D-manno-octulosonic acid transferase [Polaromonas sp. YR568]SFU84932.1 3-deoxy-D-manno-octulosonic-acid transferase [Polaromonas sp. YR568]
MSDIAFKLYSLLMWLGQPLLRRKLARRGKQEPGYLQAVEERFGRYTQPAETASELIWVHAVSLGETRTAAILLKVLRTQHPGLRILLTHGTATGRAEGVALLQPGDVQVWQPWDSAGAVARFFDHFKPRLGLLMETEIWPTLVSTAQQRAVPLVLVNGRLSEKSLQQALKISPLSMPAYAALSAVYAQTDDDAQRFRRAGATVAGVFGNLKFDAAADDAQQEKGKIWRRTLALPVLMFASSREGEEALFLKEISAQAQSERAQEAGNTAVSESQPGELPAGVQGTGSRFKVLLVPRHPQRFNEVEALVQQHGLRVSRRSGWDDAAGGPAAGDAQEADVWLGDSLGEMALYFSMSDVALLGGSFAPLGGQNLIEAAACGCPVVMGPHTFNFTEAAELAVEEGAARRVVDMEQGVRAARKLMDKPEARAAAVAAGLAFADRNRGATAKTVSALEGFLSGRGAS